MYWLASKDDAFVRAGLSDPDADSSFIDLRARYRIFEHAELEVGYAYFIPGEFVDDAGESPDSDFFYVAITLTL